MNPKSFQHSIKIRSKNEPLHVARGPFLVQRTTFLVQRAMFLRPLDERRPQSAKKVSALDVFGSPAASLCGPKVRRNHQGSPQKDPKSRKRPSQNRCKKWCRKKIPNVYQKPSKMMPKRMPNSSICYAFAKKAETLQTVCFPIENVVLGIQELRKVRQKLMENQYLKKACKK